MEPDGKTRESQRLPEETRESQREPEENQRMAVTNTNKNDNHNKTLVLKSKRLRESEAHSADGPGVKNPDCVPSLCQSSGPASPVE